MSTNPVDAVTPQAPSALLRRLRLAVEVLVVAATCWWLSPLDTRTVFAASSEYVRTTGFGPYDRIIYSHLHQRPFEVCAGVDERHAEALQRVQNGLPAIEASSAFEPVRVWRLIRAFNRESQGFYTSSCPTEWTYLHFYVDYQSWLLKVAPVIWLVEVAQASEIIVIVLLILASWFGIFSLFWCTKRLANSTLVGFASLGALWFSIWYFGISLQYGDFRLNLLSTFALAGIAQFLCDLPPSWGRWRTGARHW